MNKLIQIFVVFALVEFLCVVDANIHLNSFHKELHRSSRSIHQQQNFDREYYAIPESPQFDRSISWDEGFERNDELREEFITPRLERTMYYAVNELDRREDPPPSQYFSRRAFGGKKFDVPGGIDRVGTRFVKNVNAGERFNLHENHAAPMYRYTKQAPGEIEFERNEETLERAHMFEKNIISNEAFENKPDLLSGPGAPGFGGDGIGEEAFRRKNELLQNSVRTEPRVESSVDAEEQLETRENLLAGPVETIHRYIRKTREERRFETEKSQSEDALSTESRFERSIGAEQVFPEEFVYRFRRNASWKRGSKSTGGAVPIYPYGVRGTTGPVVYL